MGEEKMQALTIEEIKALGAPFEKAEVHVSLQKKIARLVLVVPGRKGNYPAMDFPLDCDEDCQQVGLNIIAAAGENGLLDAHSITVIFDVDSGPVH